MKNTGAHLRKDMTAIMNAAVKTVRVKAHKVCAGMTVTVTGETGEWTTLSRHPKGGHWWLHRWTDQDTWETSHAHYTHMMQVIGEPWEATP